MIRAATPADESCLRELQQSLAEPNPALLAYALPGPPLVLASVADRQPVGYLLATENDRVGYVAELAVAPDYRREGRASALLRTAVARLAERGRSRVTLSVHPDNDAARRLYERHGFEETDRQLDYYADGADALVMATEL